MYAPLQAFISLEERTKKKILPGFIPCPILLAGVDPPVSAGASADENRLGEESHHNSCRGGARGCSRVGFLLKLCFANLHCATDSSFTAVSPLWCSLQPYSPKSRSVGDLALVSDSWEFGGKVESP